MRLLVFGGRDYADSRAVFAALDKLRMTRSITHLIHGGAQGADTLASRWADECVKQELVFYADWERYGKAAGPIRNQRMIDEGKPDAAVGFPGGRGTKDMAQRLKNAGIPCWWPIKNSCPIE